MSITETVLGHTATLDTKTWLVDGIGPVKTVMTALDGGSAALDDADRERLPARHLLAGGAQRHRHRPVAVADPPADRDERRPSREALLREIGRSLTPEEIARLQGVHAAEYRKQLDSGERAARGARAAGRAH